MPLRDPASDTPLVHCRAADFDAFFAALPIGAFLVDPAAARIVACNELAAAQLGYTPAEFVGLRIDDVDFDPTSAQVRARAREAFARGLPLRYEATYRAKSGALRHMLVTAKPIDLDGAKRSLVTAIDVTQQRESTERVQLALDAGAIVGTWNWHLQTDLFIADERFARSFGLHPDHCRDGLGIDAVIANVHPEDLPRLRAAIAEAIARSGPYRCEYRVMQQDGRYRWVEANGRVDHDSDGTPLRFPGVLLDAEARKADEARLRRSAETFYSLIRDNPLGLYVVDAEFRLAHVSKGSAKVFEHVPQPLIGRDFSEVLRVVWAEPFATEAIERFRHTLASGERYEASRTTEWRADLGQVGAFDWSIERITLPDGRYGVACYSYDLSEQVRWEGRVRTSEQRFRTAVEAATDILWTNDPCGRMTGPQPGWAAFTGQSPAEYEGCGWAARLHPDDVAPTLERWGTAVAAGTKFSCEHRVRRRDGVYRTFSVRALPVRDDAGRVIEWVGVHTDVTDIRQAQDTIERQNRELLEADRRKDEFLATLAHELRNPLAPIRNALQILNQSEDAAVGAQARAMLGRQVGQMVRLVDDLLEISRITTGKLRLTCEPLGVRRILEQAIETARPQIDARDHRLVVEQPGRDVRVHGDAVRLAQVVTNLLNNAAKYSDPGGAIDVRVTVADERVRIAVADTGIGIAAEALPHVFDLFAQVESGHERTQGGLGIGLALARRLAEMHGGTLTAASGGAGRGATFTLDLPIASPGALRSDLPRETDTARSHRTVVVADDNRDAADSLAIVLELDGHRVHTCYDGVAAIRTIREARPDVAVVDLGMPGCDGLEVARAIRADESGPAPLLIALTGWGQEDDKRRTREAGFDHHFTKPVAIDVLEAVIARSERVLAVATTC